MLRKILSILLNLVFITNLTHGQISYPDTCLSIGYFYQKANNKLDTTKTIWLKTSEIPHFFFSNDIFLNLVVVYKNNCNQNIIIPSTIKLDMPGQDAFSIEGFYIEKDSIFKLQFNIEYDYFHSSDRAVLLNPKKRKLEKYSFPLGFIADKKGQYKFRLRYFNEYNYIPIAEWKYYYSNWIYLTIK